MDRGGGPSPCRAGGASLPPLPAFSADSCLISSSLSTDFIQTLGKERGLLTGSLNDMDLTDAEDIKKRWQEYTELYKKDLHDSDNHDGVITQLEPDIL